MSRRLRPRARWRRRQARPRTAPARGRALAWRAHVTDPSYGAFEEYVRKLRRFDGAFRRKPRKARARLPYYESRAPPFMRARELQRLASRRRRLRRAPRRHEVLRGRRIRERLPERHPRPSEVVILVEVRNHALH